ncbi:hypothetical protein FNT36_01705 [Hymenobacter setariae]|uniref:Secreted protein n=1 Tax=Hymenobacter setariae TaxID=2594794 RepID=A0A558C2C2_9BACT|nr:hypothetical protein [Hymenobacter setariae]TVT42832.1 hypothetical protein FNT36_01705 [Hymenobacter setariae]
MKTLRITGLLLLLLTLTAYALPAPHPESIAPQPTLGGEITRATLLRYRWVRDWGPFTHPRPGLLPDDAMASQEPGRS